MTRRAHWLDRAAVAITTPPASPPVPRSNRPSAEAVSRAQLLRDAAQRLPDRRPQLDPAWSTDTKVSRSTALRMIAALGASLTGAQLLRPIAAEADRACVSKCQEIYAKALVARTAACVKNGVPGGLPPVSIIPTDLASTYSTLGCASIIRPGLLREEAGCERQCAKKNKPKRPAPLCAPKRAPATCPYPQLPPPPKISPPPPSSNCGPSSCEQVGGLCCGAYATVESTGCVTRCSQCKNPSLGSC